MKSRGVHYSVSLPRDLIISILFILNIVSTYLMKLVTVCDHPLPLDASDWARPGRPKNKDMHDCEKCGVSFVRTKALQHHKNCKHTKIETKMKAKCKWCPYSSSLKSNVKRHEHTCRARPQIVKTLSPDAIWRIGMYQLFICLISHRKYSDNSQKKSKIKVHSPPSFILSTASLVIYLSSYILLFQSLSVLCPTARPTLSLWIFRRS